MKSAYHDQRRAMVAVSESAGSRPRVRAGEVMSAVPAIPAGMPEPQALRPIQLALLAAAVFVVSAGYGGLLPVLPAWLAQQMPQADAVEVARHVGFLSGAYAAGVLVGAPLWGTVSDRVGRPRILVTGMVGYVVSLLLLLVPTLGSLSAIYVLRVAAGLCVAAVVPVVSALVAEHTPQALRARRFAWLSAASLIGFLFGPALNALADGLTGWLRSGTLCRIGGRDHARTCLDAASSPVTDGQIRSRSNQATRCCRATLAQRCGHVCAVRLRTRHCVARAAACQPLDPADRADVR